MNKAARENIATLADDELGKVRMQNVVSKLSRTPGRIKHAGPRLGEHTAQVLHEWLGLGTRQLDEQCPGAALGLCRRIAEQAQGFFEAPILDGVLSLLQGEPREAEHTSFP